MAQGRIDETAAMLVEGIVPDTIKSESPQTCVDVPTAHQLSIHLGQVVLIRLTKDLKVKAMLFDDVYVKNPREILTQYIIFVFLH